MSWRSRSRRPIASAAATPPVDLPQQLPGARGSRRRAAVRRAWPGRPDRPGTGRPTCEAVDAGGERRRRQLVVGEQHQGGVEQARRGRARPGAAVSRGQSRRATDAPAGASSAPAHERAAISTIVAIERPAGHGDRDGPAVVAERVGRRGPPAPRPARGPSPASRRRRRRPRRPRRAPAPTPRRRRPPARRSRARCATSSKLAPRDRVGDVPAPVGERPAGSSRVSSVSTITSRPPARPPPPLAGGEALDVGPQEAAAPGARHALAVHQAPAHVGVERLRLHARGGPRPRRRAIQSRRRPCRDHTLMRSILTTCRSEAPMGSDDEREEPR